MVAVGGSFALTVSVASLLKTPLGEKSLLTLALKRAPLSAAVTAAMV